MKQLLFVTIFGAFAVSSANAGNPKEIIEPPAPAALGATLSAGYDTHYIYRGVDNGRNAISAGIDYTIDVLPLPIDLGAWYVNPTSGGDAINRGHWDELQLSASISGPELAGISTWLGYTAYLFPDNGGRTAGTATHEIGGGIGTSLGFVDATASAFYDFEIDGWYFETGVSRTLALGGFDLVIATGISYQINYWQAGDDWNHVYVSAALPISLSDTATLTPYAAGLFSLDAVDAFQDDIIHGGVSLSVSF